jgi:hypothetical protein
VVSLVATSGGPIFQHFFSRTGEQLKEATVPPKARPVPVRDPAGGWKDERAPDQVQILDTSMVTRMLPGAQGAQPGVRGTEQDTERDDATRVLGTVKPPEAPAGTARPSVTRSAPATAPRGTRAPTRHPPRPIRDSPRTAGRVTDRRARTALPPTRATPAVATGRASPAPVTRTASRRPPRIPAAPGTPARPRAAGRPAAPRTRTDPTAGKATATAPAPVRAPGPAAANSRSTSSRARPRGTDRRAVKRRGPDTCPQVVSGPRRVRAWPARGPGARLSRPVPAAGRRCRRPGPGRAGRAAP